jgi:hypothetical protein
VGLLTGVIRTVRHDTVVDCVIIFRLVNNVKLKQHLLVLQCLFTYKTNPSTKRAVKDSMHFYRAAKRKVFDGMNKGVLQSLGISAVLGNLVLSTGCAHINVKQLAYEVLRQEDCRINQLDDFCTRNFAKEYREYELLRRNFMRSQKQTAWQVSPDETSITTASIQ